MVKGTKMKITNHTELRKRQSIDCSKPVLTDQSGKKMSDINNIMLQYSRTGLLPQERSHLARYIDNTEIPSLMDAQEQINTAREMFMTLPAQIRKLMDNDPTKLIDFVKDPQNQTVLIEYGVLEKRKTDPQSTQPPVGKITKEPDTKSE